MDCLFCKIIAGEIPSSIVYRDETVVAFRDIEPQAPVHILVVPTTHYANVLEASQVPGVMDALMRTAARIAKEQGLAESGFRLVLNTGADAGQTVSHVHVHILGGKPLSTELN